MKKMKNIIIKLGQIDRRFVFLIIGLSVLFPLLYPDYFRVDIKISSYSQTVFDTVDKFRDAEEYIDSNKNDVRVRNLLTKIKIVYGMILLKF